MNNIVNINEGRSTKFQYHTIFFMTIIHAMAIWALFTFSWQNLAVAGVLWWVSGSVGIGLGYHRLLTHRGFKVPKPVEYLMTACGALALQAGPLSWVTTHRIHHAFTDKEKDPHSPRAGVFWSHMGWILKGTAQEHDLATHKRYSPDLVNDKFYQFLNNYYWLTNVVVGVALFAIGGWSMVLWGVFLRVVWGWHVTWLVNSMTHIWGSRRFETTDDSRNNALIGILAWGEGWHNNHHAYPRSARHGLKWYEFDANWVQILLMRKIGLAKDVYAVDLNETKNKAIPLTKPTKATPLQKAA
jgi:stearoyl-CoA desaturase (delta-9 desaturase)